MRRAFFRHITIFALILFSFDCRAQCPQALADLLATAVEFFDPADSPNAPQRRPQPWRCTNGANIITDSRFCTASASATGHGAGVSTDSA